MSVFNVVFQLFRQSNTIEISKCLDSGDKLQIWCMLFRHIFKSISYRWSVSIPPKTPWFFMFSGRNRSVAWKGLIEEVGIVCLDSFNFQISMIVLRFSLSGRVALLVQQSSRIKMRPTQKPLIARLDIWDGLCDLAPFVQFKEREKHPWRGDTFSKVTVLSLKFTKSNTPPWVFFTFFKLYEWCQISQRIIFGPSCQKFWCQLVTVQSLKLNKRYWPVSFVKWNLS